MEVDDGNETKDASSLIESALPTWKMLYNPLTTLLKDLDNAVDDLEYVLSEFLSFENSFSAIFVPRNNSSFNASDYEEVEQKYFSFTLWFQGSLFYLLTFTHLKRIHPLAVKLQIKILTVVTTHPLLYKQLSSEYLKSLKTILQSKYIEIKHFLTETVELEDDVKLTPNFGMLTADNENNILLSLIEIIEYILRREINNSIFSNSFINDTWNALIQIVNTTSISAIQMNCLRSLNLILKINCCAEKFTSQLEIYFLKFIQSIKNLDYTFIDTEFGEILQDILDIFKISQHDTSILLNILHLCKIIAKNCSQQILIEKAESLTRKIICENPFIISNNCEYINNDYTRIAIEIQRLISEQTNQSQMQLVFDFKLPVLNELIDKSEINSIDEIKQFFNSLERIFLIVLESTYMCEKSFNLYCIPKYFNEDILIKVVSKFQSMNFHKLKDEINQETFVKTFYYLIVLTNTTNSIKIRSYLEWMSKIQNKISNNSEIWLLTYIHCQQKEYLNGLNNYLQFSNECIHQDVLKNIPFLIDSNAIDLQKALNEWLKPWFDKVFLFLTKKPDLERCEKEFEQQIKETNLLCEALIQIICISGKKYIVVNYFDKEIRYEVICAHCNRIMDTDNQSKYWFNNRLHSVDQVIFKTGVTVEKILVPFLKLFSAQTVITNMIPVLTAVSFHYPKLITMEMVERLMEIPIQVRSSFHLNLSKVTCENFPKIIGNIQNCTSLDTKLKEEILEKCAQGLAKNTQKCLAIDGENQDFKQIQIIVMDMILHFGLLNPTKNSILISLKLLLHFALNIKSNVQEFACIYIEDLAHALDLSNNQFYIDYKKDICKTIIELSVLNYVHQKISFSSPLHKLSRTFGFLSLNDFIVQEGRYLLPYLIPWIAKLPYLKALLDSVSDMALVPTSELIVNQFGNIYPHIFINETDEMYEKCMRFLRTISKNDVATLRRKHFRIIFNELLLYFHKNPDRILNGLKILFQDEMDIQNNQEVIHAIQSRFLGLLVYFDSKLNSKRVAISDKRNALQSLPEIIKLIGPKQITPLRFKVMATLHTTLQLGDMEQLSCLVWDAFIKNCDIDAIGPLLSTVFTSLLPLHKKYPNLINEIFMYLVCDHEQDLCENLPDLFFVIESDVNDRIKSVVKNAQKNYLLMNFRDQLKFYLKYLQHDNIEVRIHGLNFTTKLLEDNRRLLNKLILGSNGLDPIVVELIDLLVTGFTEKNVNYYLACSKCIGELGAMEPSHLPKRYANHNETFTFTINEDNFAIKALNELIRAFQSEKYSQNMDCFALAIQEILKSYNVNPSSTGGSSSNAIWNHFPENQQQIMQPLFTSRYKIAFQAEKPTGHPLFQSDNTKTFIDWIHRWIAKLIPLIKTESCRYLFDCCQPSLRKDMQVLMFFLPYILLHSLLEADSMDRKQIYEEMVTVFESYKNKGQNIDEHRQFKPLKSDLLRYMPSLPTNEQMTLAQAAKVVYVLLDFLLRWLREWEQQYCPGKSPDKDPKYIKINSFVQKFCKLSIAQSNYNHEEFPRALMYLEDYVNENPNDLEKQLGFFTRIYVQLDDADSVAGIRSIQQNEPLLEDMILSHEISGQLHDATACYERLAQEVRLHPQTLQGLIRCHLDLDNPYTAHRIIEGLDNKTYDFSTSLYECEVETLWRLHDYDKLESVLNNLEFQKMSNWSVNLGNILLNFHKGNQENFWKEIAETRCLVVQPLSVSSRDEGSYENGYPQVMKLHLLNELEKVQNLVDQIKNSSKDVNICSGMIDKLILEFDQRETLVQSSVRVLEPVYCLRRTALQQAQELLEKNHLKDLNNVFNKHIGNYWLKSAQVARVTGMYQQAYINLLNAEKYKPVGLFIEKAKLHWARGEQEIAFSILKRGIESASITTSNDNTSMRKIIAEAKLLVALYNEETANLDVEANIAKYKEAVECNKECEKSMVYLARYYDKALSTMTGDKDVGLGGDMQLHMIHNFGKSLQFGKEFLYQSMPRMLSIWLDYGSRQFENKDKETFEIKSLNVLKMTKLISTYLDRLPTYMFLSAFSQIVSRICHPQKQVYQQLKSIIVKLIISYPQQTLWMIMSVYKSSYSVRVKRCQEILQDPRLKGSTRLMTLIQDFNRLAEKLIELCNKPISNGVSTTSVSTLIKSLPRLITSSEFSQIMVPVEQYLKMVLPTNNENLINFNPYPKQLVYIIGIDETVTIMPSLQRPRRITLLGSDGKKYMHMLKPKDDLRKDFRLMEFNGVVNQFLYQESESRQRRLHIRTYAVVPLNEECGIIEWVSDLIPFRAIILKLHKQKNSFVSPKELRTMMCNIRDSLQKKRQVYLELMCPRHPLVFHEWFRLTFSDPHAWYQARTSYIRTTATISIVGYILGLGDRHGENILFDSTNGETVHVDFNCLFNRGEALEWPERVPFRLTPNMVKAMGPLGVEGVFRRSCEVTLRVLRSQKDTLMSILKPFVYDPLVSWPKTHASNLDANAERTNEQARDHVRNIESRLQGIKGGGKLPIRLSVEGHVNSLILDATSIDNLCQMYVGWGSFL